jgi:inosine/xanthosine triphosphate pyrophosphatase family protein
MCFYFRFQILAATLLVLTIAACGGESRPQSPAHPAAETLAPIARADAAATIPSTFVKPQLSFAITDALARTRDVRNVRYEITSQVSLTQDSKTIQQPGLNAQGAESGENRQLTLSGIMNATGQATKFEFITLDGVTFIKGLNGIPGVNPAQWYRFPQELGNVTHDAPGVKSLLAQLETQDIQNAEFQNAGSETIDGQSCEIWYARDPKLAVGLLGIAGSAQANNQLQALDVGEFRVWTCADGFLHRLTGLVQGHDPSNPNNRATVQLTVHLYDHNADIAITAPPDARDFQVPITEESQAPTPKP